MEVLLERLALLANAVANISPRILGAVAFLVVGVVAAWLIDRALDRICTRLHVDESSGGRRLIHIGASIGLKTTPSVALRHLARWTILIVAAAQAAFMLELEAVASVIDRVVWIAPILLVVLVVLYVGATLSERLARFAHAAAERDGTIPPILAATVVRVVIIAAAVIVAVEAGGVTANLPVLVFSICLAGVLTLVVAALIIGGRGLLESMLAARYVEEQYIEGQMVTFRSERAQIRSIGLMATVVRTSDGVDHTTPNAIFLKESV